jgi:hypothetical protein
MSEPAALGPFGFSAAAHARKVRDHWQPKERRGPSDQQVSTKRLKWSGGSAFAPQNRSLYSVCVRGRTGLVVQSGSQNGSLFVILICPLTGHR